ncbi:hypothetical protein, partial [Weissella cibaria]|uniref:hypothetical protein n=1 Tax=Weissella cibaria TaxID=137591 RepID=UPI0021C20199
GFHPTGESAKPAETVLTCCFSGFLFVLMNNPGIKFYTISLFSTIERFSRYPRIDLLTCLGFSLQKSVFCQQACW